MPCGRATHWLPSTSAPWAVQSAGASWGCLRRVGEASVTQRRSEEARASVLQEVCGRVCSAILRLLWGWQVASAGQDVTLGGHLAVRQGPVTVLEA